MSRKSPLLFIEYLILAAIGPTELHTSAEVVFQDFFTSPVGNITNSVPWIDVQGGSWQSGPVASQLALDASGHVYNAAASAGAEAGVPLIPTGPYGSMTASALMKLPVRSTEWIGAGFANSNQLLSANASGSGPWVQVIGTGTMILYGGPGLNNPTAIANAFTNSGAPIQVFLSYDVFHATATAGTITYGITNLIFNQTPVTNTFNTMAPRYLVLQISTNLTTATSRWVTAATVDWLPRPPPMLTLPVPITKTVLVGSPGSNNVHLIQSALNSVAGSASGTELRFNQGATYVVTNNSLVPNIPLRLQHATNVLVNGNGCKILVTNPRIGFLTVDFSSNVIVQGFTVDYDPLPYTQGTVTHNFYTGGDVPPEQAIEFQVDTGYAAPTNANYTDPNAARWGLVMDPVRIGRMADGAFTACLYTNVIQTNRNGAFKVYLQYSTAAKSVQPGDRWNMISRWNGSPVFFANQSYQVTWLNNTNYTGAGFSYGGDYSPLLCEINDQIQLGPPPVGATASRLRSSNADGGVFGNTRIGPWVQGCNFTGLSDDVANATLSPFIVTNVPAQPTNTLSLWQTRGAGTMPIGLLPLQAQAGDTVLFFNPITGAVFDSAIITSVDLPNVTFDHTVSNIVAGTYDTGTMLLDRNLNTSAVYLDNQFSNSRIHGIYCRADHMLIAHNTISGMGSSAICAFPSMTSGYLNHFVPTNVVIINNVLSDCSFSYEALNNAIPKEEPNYALVELHNATLTSHYVTNGLVISGIRILYNAFLNWRRAPLSLHNATDVRVIGNYFGPPLTNDGLVPLSEDILADLWASDYPGLVFSNNVNATTLPDAHTISESGTNTSITGAFQLLSAPHLTSSLNGSNVVVSWVSAAPGFVLQQAGRLATRSNDWQDVPASPALLGQSNAVVLPLVVNNTNQFYRARQR